MAPKILHLLGKFNKKKQLKLPDTGVENTDNMLSAAAGGETAAPFNREISEESLKKSIADKLQTYRPAEKEANFTGPSFRS